ncbi:MAG: choice-of-anchor Q domain-containing protein, partial [Gammaproteobacteria bacterium]
MPSFAFSYTVNSTVDAVDSDTSDGLCADAAGNCTLRAAIQQANAWPGGDYIVLPAGTFNLSLAGNDDVAASGDLDILEDLTITGEGSTGTIIDGGGMDRIFQVFAGTTVTLDGLALQNGKSNNSGGAIASDGNLTIRNAILRNNSTLSPTQGGGAIYSSSSLTMEQVILQNNNTAANGGAINLTSGNSTISTSLIDTNSATFNGGGLYINGGVTATISDTVISGNTATGSSGTSGLGGGIFNFGALTITRSTLNSNSALMGGAIYNEGSKSATSPITATLMVEDTTISGNTATDSRPDTGGGVFNSNLARFTNTTVTRNSAVSGAGIAMDTSGSPQNQGFLDLQNSIVTDQASGENCSGTGNITSQGFNLDNDNTCNLGASGDLPGTTAPVLDLNLTSNGGATPSHALLASSPAIDAIASGCDNTVDDQRGIKRANGTTSGTACDMGAYERTTLENSWADLEITAETTPNPALKSSPLTYIVTVFNRGPASATNILLSDSDATPGLNGQNLGSLAPGTSTTFSTVPPATAPASTGPHTNTISVAATETDQVAANNSATVSTLVVTNTDLAITTSVRADQQALATGVIVDVQPNDTIIAGFPVTYTLTVSNTGDLARDTLLTNELPANVVLQSLSAVPASVNCTILSSSRFTCDMGDLASGATATITFVAVPQTTGTVANVAYVNFTGVDTTPASDSFPLTVITQADLS